MPSLGKLDPYAKPRQVRFQMEQIKLQNLASLVICGSHVWQVLQHVLINPWCVVVKTHHALFAPLYQMLLENDQMEI